MCSWLTYLVSQGNFPMLIMYLVLKVHGDRIIPICLYQCIQEMIQTWLQFILLHRWINALLKGRIDLCINVHIYFLENRKQKLNDQQYLSASQTFLSRNGSKEPPLISSFFKQPKCNLKTTFDSHFSG